MNVNDGLLLLEKVFPSLSLRPDVSESCYLTVVERLHLLASYYSEDVSVQSIINEANRLGLWVRPDGLVYVVG